MDTCATCTHFKPNGGSVKAPGTCLKFKNRVSVNSWCEHFTTSKLPLVTPAPAEPRGEVEMTLGQQLDFVKRQASLDRIAANLGTSIALSPEESTERAAKLEQVAASIAALVDLLHHLQAKKLHQRN